VPGEQTPEEVQNQHIELMGPELGAAYDVLRYGVTVVFANWSLYKQLYAQPDRLQVLADLAGNFFGLLRHTLFLHTRVRSLKTPGDTVGSGRRCRNSSYNARAPHMCGEI
jgi:hypothetical protein